MCRHLTLTFYVDIDLALGCYVVDKYISIKSNAFKSYTFTVLFSRGQLGHGNTESVSSPRVIEALDGVTMLSIAAGGWHSSVVSGEFVIIY